MSAYLLKRVLYLLPILLGVNLLVFAMFFLVNSPDDMAREALGEKASSQEQIERWKSAHGYDHPLFLNPHESGFRIFTRTIFFEKSLALLWGEMGRSDRTGERIAKELSRRFLPSFALALPIFLATLLANVVLALYLASIRGSFADRLGQFACIVLMSISTILLIIFGQYVAAYRLRLCPVSGFAEGWRMFPFLLLPATIGFLAGIGSGTRLYRTFFLEQMNQDFVRTARAKGLPENVVLFRHVLRNALLPILTNIPSYLLQLFTGNLLLEKFFNIPGLGGYTIDAIAAQDFAAVRAMVFLGAVLYAGGLLLADVAYTFADPRIRYA